jgi:hypothetical protein
MLPVSTLTPMTESAQPRRRGRPPTGITPKRYVRVGVTWDQLEAVAKETTGETMPKLINRLVAAELRRLTKLREKQELQET